MKVLKYGGSSVSTIDQIKSIATYIRKRVEDEKLVVVVSAMGKTTNNLIALASQVTSNPHAREMDMLMSTGEIQAISILTLVLRDMGVDAISLTGFQAGINTEGFHRKSIISNIDQQKIQGYLEKYDVLVVAGFQGLNAIGDITTLGRGGSDTTAVALAATLKCDCEIYTDVDGIYSVDPRIYPDAKKLEKIDYNEMMELSVRGAKIMEVRSIELAKKYDVNLYIALSLGTKPGTKIIGENTMLEKKTITGVSCDKNCLLLECEGVPITAENLYTVFNTMERHGVNIDLISQSVAIEHKSLAFTCQESDIPTLHAAIKDLKQVFPSFKSKEYSNVSKVSVVGVGMISSCGIAARVFKVLYESRITYHQISTSEISISLIVDKENDDLLVVELAKEFELYLELHCSIVIIFYR